jgi:anti-sigma regulatory factor (Ser/Thr protein kinase)
MAQAARSKKITLLNLQNAKTSLLKVDAGEHNLSIIRKFINVRMKKAGFSAYKTAGLVVSVIEHFENLIRHAYREKAGEIEIKLEIKRPVARITILDNGPEFNMKKKRIPNIQARLKNGFGGRMGIKTILALCDKVEYERKDGYNENSFIIIDKK